MYQNGKFQLVYFLEELGEEWVVRAETFNHWMQFYSRQFELLLDPLQLISGVCVSSWVNAPEANKFLRVLSHAFCYVIICLGIFVAHVWVWKDECSGNSVLRQKF